MACTNATIRDTLPNIELDSVPRLFFERLEHTPLKFPFIYTSLPFKVGLKGEINKGSQLLARFIWLQRVSLFHQENKPSWCTYLYIFPQPLSKPGLHHVCPPHSLHACIHILTRLEQFDSLGALVRLLGVLLVYVVVDLQLRREGLEPL